MGVHPRLPLVVFAGALMAAAAYFEFHLAAGASSAHSRMNAEGIAAVAFVGATIARAAHRKTFPIKEESWDWDGPATALAFFAIAGSVLLFRMPFLYDDYTHLTEILRQSWHSPLLYFGRVAHPPGLFFRPFGFVLYELSYLWAGTDAVRWHAISFALHTGCGCLTFVLCRKLGSSRFASLMGALLFTLNGCTAEAVAWVDARFDLIATFLALLCLIAVLRFAASGHRIWLGVGLLLQAVAILTKESAFCLPLIVACLTLFFARPERRRLVFATLLSSGMSVVLWLYRWWALGGLGGYRGLDGLPAVTAFHPLQTLEGLILRQSAILFFPLNWSQPPGIALRGALAMLPVVLIACMLLAHRQGRSCFRSNLGAVGMIIFAALPVQHLLLVGPDLSGAFRVYLPSVGLAILWSQICDGIPGRPRMAIVCILVLINSAILEHNLAVWRNTANVAKAFCTSFGRTLEASADTVWVEGLPAKRLGVVFLANGFPECVAMNSGIPAARIQVANVGQKPASAARVFSWNDKAVHLEPR